FIASIKNCSPITWTDIGELAVRLGRIDLLPIDVEQLLVGNFGRIVNNLDRFPVVRLLRADELVSGIGFGPAAVTDCRLDHTGRLVECRLNTPETTARKNGALCRGG